MAEQKAKSAAKKATPVKSNSATAVKSGASRKSPASAIRKVSAPALGKKAPAKKPLATAPGSATRKTSAKPTAEERYLMVQTAAYFIAERSGFSGSSIEHWAAAELEIANRLGAQGQ